MPLIEFADIPVVRRAALRLRAIERLLRDQGSRLEATERLVHDLAFRLDMVGGDSAALLDATQRSATVLGGLDGCIRSLVARTQDISARDTAALTRHREELGQAVTEIRRRNADLRLSVAQLEQFMGTGVSELLGELTEHLRILVPSGFITGDSAAEEVADRTLVARLAPYLRDVHAMDIGAHRGTYTKALLEQGLQVVAVEPDATLATDLEEELGAESRASVRQAAIAERAGRAPIYRAVDTTPDLAFGDMSLFTSLIKRDHADGMAFEVGPEVDTLTIDELRIESGWPARIGFVKIDVEGAALRVLAGFGDTRPEVLMVEYWGDQYMLATDDSATGVTGLIEVALELGLRRWVTIIHHPDYVSFAVNNRTVPPTSWGNVVFIEDRDTFMMFVRWCEAVLKEEMRV